MTISLLILNGPNLNLLGTRQPEIYGSTSLSDIEKACRAHSDSVGATVTFEQSNHEGQLIDILHAAKGVHAGIIFNAGAYTHTSLALADAVASIEIPTIELHLSNVHARESVRHKSFLAPVVVGQICGFGPDGYPLAMTAMVKHLNGYK